MTGVAVAAGFGSVQHLIKGTSEAPEGRVLLASA